MTIQEILNSDDIALQKALFQFDSTDSDEAVLLKFNLWVRFFFFKFFKVKDAPFHKDIDASNLAVYRAKLKDFVDLAFRGASKTTRTKLFLAYCVANDIEHSRRYIKVLSHDISNCKQFVTDVYNLLIDSRVKQMYPEIFEKTETKREETMGAFTTATGIKMQADTVGSSQRGSIQEESRPDVIVFDDFETRETLRSAVKTKTIHDNMEEAKNGLAYNGGSIYLGNYISEMGNVHRLVESQGKTRKVLIVPIIENGILTWPALYKMEDIEHLRNTADDFEGEYLCKPNASKDIYFDREMLDKMEARQPVKEVSGFKMYREYNPSHRYAGGHDVAGGVGLDSSASVFHDFSTIPAQVVATYHSNTIAPEAFGDEIYDEANHFGGCLVAPENNKFDQTILKAKQRGAKIYKSVKGKTAKTISVSMPKYNWGWETNSLTKSQMMADYKKAVNDGLVELNDPDLIKEAKAYTRNDLIDGQPDPRDVALATRHFDLLTAAAISWQMKDRAEAAKEHSPYIEIGATQEDLSVNPSE